MRKISFRINSIFFVLILLLVAIFGTFLMSFGTINTKVSEVNNSNTVADTQTLNNKYASFKSGSTYTYTAYFTQFAPDLGYYTKKVNDDTFMVEVDATKPHGSWQNPYVIANTTHWNNLVNDGATQALAETNTKNKFFALTTDLTFTGTFPSVEEFHGTFFGLGHSINNPVYASGTANAGIFNICRKQATITDLSVENYTCTNYGNSSESHIGGIVGYAPGGACFYNCHTVGSFTKTNNIASTIYISGLLGMVIGEKGNSVGSDATVPFTAYRSSTKITNQVKTPNVTSYAYYFGGFIGDIARNTQVNVVDCYANVTDTSVYKTNSFAHYGGVGVSENTNGDILIKNFVSKSNIDLKGSSYGHASGAKGMTVGVLGIVGVDTNLITKSITIENTYSFGEVLDPANSARHSLYSVLAFSNVVGSNYQNFYNKIPNKTYKNVNTAKPQKLFYHENTNFVGKIGSTNSQGVASTPEATEAALWVKAKNDPELSSKIWEIDKISADENPLQKTEIKTQDFECTYNNLVNGKAEPISGLTNTKYNYENSVDLEVPPTVDNRKFLGWTTDKTGESEPFTKLSIDFYGDVTLYAVWDVVNIDTQISTDDVLEIEYGTDEIILRANVTATGMTDPNIKYQWYKDGNAISGSTSSTLRLKNVLESGDYTFECWVSDKTEPLWRGTKKLKTATTVTITTGTLDLTKFDISKDTPAFSGKQLSEVNFTVTVENKAGDEVAGTANWKYSIQNVADGKNNVDIVFNPTDKDNYGEKKEFKVEFEAEYVQLIFKLDDLSTEFKVNLAYGQNYNSTQIRNMFVDSYKKFIKENPNLIAVIADKTPMFDGVEFDKYNQSLTQVKQNQTINVTFVVKDYMVKFDPQNGEEITEKAYHYGNYILEPATPANGSYFFMGWYWDKPLEGGNTEKTRWNFNNDIVTDNLTLYAVWSRVTWVLTSIEISQVNFNLLTLSSIVDGDLKVVAHFEADDGSVDPITEEIYLKGSDQSSIFGYYSIEYSSLDKVLHFTNSKITIKFSYGGVDIAEDFNVKVKQIDITPKAEDLEIDNEPMIYDGQNHKIEVYFKDSTKYPNIDINNITYEYLKGGVSVGTDGVKEVGKYSVVVTFPTNSQDYSAETILVDFEILPENTQIEVSIEWTDSEFVYKKNTVQHPTFIVKDSEGKDITHIMKDKLVLGGDYETSIWEGAYVVTATLKAGAATKYVITDGAEFNYHIAADENGAGGINDPENPNNPNRPDNPDNPDDPDDDGGFVLPENFPLWQVIAGGVALILGIIFFIRTGMNDSKRRKFKQKTQKTKKMYSFAITPIVLLGAAYLGLEQNIWTIIACGLIGFCVIGFISMLGSGHARKKAEVGYENAVEEMNAAIERKKEEEQRAKEEEQRRRDEEMKMMFMAMMNKNGSGANGTADGEGGTYTAGIAIEEIVSKTVAALMPAMQTLMITDHSSADNEAMTRLLDQQEKLIAKLMETPAIAATRAVDDDEDEDEEEMEWDEESDEEEIDEVTPIEMVSPNGEITMTEAVVKKTIKLPTNFRARLKISSDKNREAYVALKNHLCSKRGITFRVSGRVEKVKYKGELICVIGVATKHLKLWFALDVDAFDKRRYFQKDVSDKPRYAQVPMLVKVGSERALTRAIELIDVLCEKFDIANKRRYTDKNLQVLAYTLKHNALLKAKMTDLLCDSIHVHDADVISDEDALMSVERRIVASLEEDNFATLKLDDIDNAFVDGQKVTLDALKKKGLVDEDRNGYKVVAGTRLTKPLIIIANEFTTAAAKMIVLTGGRAILLLQSLDN